MARLLVHNGANTELATVKEGSTFRLEFRYFQGEANFFPELTPLLIALDNPDGTELVRYLLAAGANPHVKTKTGEVNVTFERILCIFCFTTNALIW